MPDNKGIGWRKKIQGKSKEPQSGKAVGDDATALEDPVDRRRHGWRITMPGSRPTTPVSRGPPTPVTDDAEEGRIEQLEATTSRPAHKPKLTKYTSLFSGFKETPKGPEFDEPWSEERPPALQPYVDPLVVLQSVREHMVTNSLIPIPLSYNNGLFCIFEDYRKVRDAKEQLESALQEKLQESDKAVEFWSQEELRYRSEIRRLELVIANSPSGVAGVLNARQGSVIDRKRKDRNLASNVASSSMANYKTPEQLDKEITLACRDVFLRRPTSPSSRMVVLSKQLAGTADIDMHIGTPPNDDKNTGVLSRKVQSELDLAKLNTTYSAAGSDSSDFSSGRAGDLLPDELPSTLPTATECDTFVALRVLATAAARMRGVDTNFVVDNVMAIFTGADCSSIVIEKELPHQVAQTGYTSPQGETDVAQRNPMQRLQSQSELGSIYQRSRNFSFEAGQDYLQALGKDLGSTIREERHVSLSRPRFSTPEGNQDMNLEMPFGEFATGETSLPYANKSSKIPSPVQPLGRVRRENSASSSHSIIVRKNEEQRNSRSSVLTAFRDKLPENLHPVSRSRSSSRLTTSPSLKEQIGKGPTHNPIPVVGATQAMEQVSRAVQSPTISGATVSTVSPSIQTTYISRHIQNEDDQH